MRLATWNIGSSLGQDISNSIEYIAENAEKNLVDVLCLQEVITSGNCDYVNELKKRLSFEYSISYELSSAHQNDNSMMGIAILSRYKIAASYEVKLTNPNISFVKNGNCIYSDDKGLLIADIIYAGKIVKIVTGHMLPFHSLGSDSKEYKSLYEEMYSKVKIFCHDVPFVLCGDFNSSKLERLIPDISKDLIEVFHEATRYNGRQNDYIFLSREWLCKSFRIDMNEYDHFLCVCEIELKSRSDLTLLHLSDIHYLSKDSMIDEKTKIAKVEESDIRKKLFTEKIKNTLEQINYVIVSGDVTTGGKKAGFEDFNEFVYEMQRKYVLPPSNHFVIVPGNHDVGGDDNRWNDFSQLLGGNFVRPWIEDIDRNTYDLLNCFSINFETEKKSIFGFIEDSTTMEKIHFPFLLDIENNVFIYAFNSSSISRTKIVLEKEDEEVIERVKAKKQNRDITRLLTLFETELQIDPARVDPQELFLFDEFVKRIEKHIDLSTYYKIAVLHHHTTTISCAEEIKKFDNIVNAGLLKKQISDKSFQIVMHGHKHNANIFFDSAIENNKQLLVISGGTVFGYSNGKANGFYVHSIKNNILYSQYVYISEGSKEDSCITKLSGDRDIGNGLSLFDIYSSIEHAVIQHINKEQIAGQTYTGWSKNIEERRVGVISTVYGLLILEKLKSTAKYYVQRKNELVESLWKFRHKNGGWGAVSQITSSGAPEATAWVVLALFMVKSPMLETALEDFSVILERMKDDINSNFTLGLVINILCEVDPSSKFIPEFCDKLLASAVREEGKIKYWCSKCKDTYVSKIEPSIVHTACAILALYKSQEKGIISRNLKEELSETRSVLFNRSLWKNTQEAISIQIGDKEDSLIVHYYTIAWVLKALLHMENYVNSSIIHDAVTQLLKSYKNGYWDYDGSNYIWTIYDALTSLEEYILKK